MLAMSFVNKEKFIYPLSEQEIKALRYYLLIGIGIIVLFGILMYVSMPHLDILHYSRASIVLLLIATVALSFKEAFHPYFYHYFTLVTVIANSWISWTVYANDFAMDTIPALLIAYSSFCAVLKTRISLAILTGMFVLVNTISVMLTDALQFDKSNILTLIFVLAFFNYASFRAKLTLQYKLRSLNANLEGKVAMRTKELQEANNTLIEANQELERFAYIASHDLKEPLRNIMGFLTLIQRRTSQNLDSDTKEYIQYVITNAKQMNSLITDVLEFSKLNSSKMAFTMVNINEVIHKINHSLHNTLQEKNAVIETDKLPSIQGNGNQLFLVFKNLIENGIKYNKSEQPTVTIACQQYTEKRVLFIIKDNGIGIPQEYHHQIFDMFKRLHSRMEYDGTGIGLAICKKIISRHQGKIWLESEVGQGSTFFIQFATQ